MMNRANQKLEGITTGTLIIGVDVPSGVLYAHSCVLFAIGENT